MENTVEKSKHQPCATESLDCMKHPLEHTWDFWLFTNKHKHNWELNLVNMTQFETVEDFWCLYHHMKLPSELKFGQDFCVFKERVRPMWEDSANRSGGRWLIPLEKRKSDLDAYWLEVVLLVIGENFENNDEIRGVVVNVRAKSRINIWMADSSKEQANCEVGRKVKHHLGIQDRLYFQAHNANINLYSV